ncbi:hypothetical protein GCM10022420_028140 [Streptomyces iranensis]|uniref:Uncharacterized protein n=1 Tax=Streptomyces iranensis TaxID=576784 RepID=A0A061AAV9_9ACTN|nr:predicted protein [Streptomyces iranensis]
MLAPGDARLVGHPGVQSPVPHQEIGLGRAAGVGHDLVIGVLEHDRGADVMGECLGEGYVASAGQEEMDEIRVEALERDEIRVPLIRDQLVHLGGHLHEGQFVRQTDERETEPPGLVDQRRGHGGESPAAELDDQRGSPGRTHLPDVAPLLTRGPADAQAGGQEQLATGQELGDVRDLHWVDPADRMVEILLARVYPGGGAAEYFELQGGCY